MTKRIAIVGGGIAGLACAYFLRDRADIHLFEASDRLGGHVHAVTVDTPAGPATVETGFLAFHRSRYPVLARLLDTFGIRTAPSGFGLTIRDPAVDLCFRAADWFRLAGPSLDPALRPDLADLLARLYRLERDPDRFAFPAGTLGEFVASRGYCEDLARYVVTPAMAALWGFQPADILAMSARAVLESLGRFLVAAHDDPFERIVPDTGHWIGALTGTLTATIRCNCPVRAVRDEGRQVAVCLDGGTELFDQAVLATHADDALALLANPSRDQERLLGSIPYVPVRATVHTDESLLPERSLRSEYTWLRGPSGGACLTTWDFERIAGLAPTAPLLVTVGPPDVPPVQATCELVQVTYKHPALTPAAVEAGAALQDLNAAGLIRFCGSYVGSTGANECAVASAERAAGQVAIAGRLPSR